MNGHNEIDARQIIAGATRAYPSSIRFVRRVPSRRAIAAAVSLNAADLRI
jgi:hypothetical protein